MTNKKPSKYRNQPIEIDGHKFPSIKEANRYIYLKWRLQAGEISDLRLQVPFELQPKFTNRRTGEQIGAIKYIADFVYRENSTGKIHIEDAKGFKTDVYKLKKKMMLFKGFEIEEV